MERRNRRQVTLQREEIDTARRHGPKRDTKKGAETCPFGSSMVRENQRKCFRKNGGDDEIEPATSAVTAGIGYRRLARIRKIRIDC